MSATAFEVDAMEPKAQKSSPVRLTEEAIKWARIASGYTGESMTEYVSRIVAEHAQGDVERLHADTVARQMSLAKKAPEHQPMPGKKASRK
jgi:hypothetical protein